MYPIVWTLLEVNSFGSCLETLAVLTSVASGEADELWYATAELPLKRCTLEDESNEDGTLVGTNSVEPWFGTNFVGPQVQADSMEPQMGTSVDMVPMMAADLNMVPAHAQPVVPPPVHTWHISEHLQGWNDCTLAIDINGGWVDSGCDDG